MRTVAADRGEGMKIGALKLANASSIPGRSDGINGYATWACEVGIPARWR